MAAAAQTFTIQLNSSAAERTSASEERYQIALTPASEVPYLAQPRAQLESLAFSNSFTNVSAHLDNNKIALQLAYTKTAPDASGNYVLEATLTDKRYELTIPDGHYDAAGLEEEMARQAYLTHKASDKVVASHAAYEPPSAITPDTSLWADLNVLVTRRPFVNAPKTPGTTGGTTDSDTSSWRLAANVAAGATSIEIVAQYNSATGQPAGFHLIGATITSVITDTGGVAGMFAADTIVTYIAPPSADKQVIHLSKAVVTAVGTNDERDKTAVLLTPEAHYGYGVKAVAEPSLDPSSEWGQVLGADEMQLIAETKGSRANGIIPTQYVQKNPTDDKPTAITQAERYVKPFYLDPDPTTGRMRIHLAVPGVAVMNDTNATAHGLRSSLIEEVLGYSTTDASLQDPLINRPGGTGKPWTADGPGRLLRTRSLQFHVPTLISSSYAPDGKLGGGAIASVPIVVPPGYVQAWQSQYDSSVPTALHGGAVDAVQFFITNQDGEVLHNQGQTFQATLRISWDDPVPPQIGSAGADAESAFGLRDVMYAR